MAKIVDPDQLNLATEIVVDANAKTIQLLGAGNLDDNSPGKTSGVTLQAIYSFLKEVWQSNPSYNKFKFPLKAITEAKMDVINNWDWADQQTRNLIRDGGWHEILNDDEYAGIISLGDMNDPNSDQAYYQQITGFDQSVVNFDKTGELNEAIRIYDGTNDYTGFLKVYLREEAKLYSETNLLVDQDLSALDYAVYRLPLANATDIKVTHTDNDIDTTTPYTTMSLDFLNGSGFTSWAAGSYDTDDVVTNGGRWWRSLTDSNSEEPTTPTANWERYPGERQIGTNWYAFNRIIDANTGTGTNPTAEQIYEWAERQLRKNSNINSNDNGDNFGTVNGNVAVLLLGFLGDTLQTQPGVYVDDFNVNDQNRIEFFDITADGGGLDTESVPATSTKRTFPFVSAGTLVFSSNLVNETNANTVYTMFFKNANGNQYDTTNAIIVDDGDSLDITGQVSQQNITFSFDYDTNVQGGRSSGTDADVVVIAMGLGSSEWVEAEFTITRATGLTFPVNAPDERNYANPA